jgi:hypothetical protein
VVESKDDIEIVTQAMAHGGDLGLLLVKDEPRPTMRWRIFTGSGRSRRSSSGSSFPTGA